jgi:hypothetical protein
VHQGKATLPPGRIRTLADVKAADDAKVHTLLQDEQVRPVMQNRTYKLEEPNQVLGSRTPLNLAY